jgi:glutamate 5-kinase
MKTVVIKIGGSTLARDGHPDEEYLQSMARQVVQLREEGWRAVVVTSGAIRVGLATIGRSQAQRLPEKQAAAAIGQSLVMRAYRRSFNAVEMHVAQLLLTRADTADRRRFLNARHTMEQLFRWGVVPIVNENDTVATEEIRFGDNDTLAALTALVAEAHLVVLLSDVDGFYMPGANAPLQRVETISPEIEAAAGGAGTPGGTGGMRTKLEAARIAMQAGMDLVIAQGREPEAILRLARGEKLGTCFAAQPALRGRKRWIAHGHRPAGMLVLNDCARKPLVTGASLLPIGITDVEGEFAAGALVSLRDSLGEYGRGLSNFSSSELRRIAGMHSSQIARVLGRTDCQEAIHRDNLTLNLT